MKLQHLSILFLLIILPILMVLTVYVDNHIEAINLKNTYDTKLLDATYDALKSYQLNTINNSISDISASKIDELEAAVKTFYNSLSTSLGYTGYKSTVMQEYVPAVVFGMYDGYYIYSPYRNVLTGVPSTDAAGDPYVDDDYNDNTVLEGLKPYVYYSCRYRIDANNDFVITYTLDNYITIQGYVFCDEDGDGTNEKTYINKYGYLIDGITRYSDGVDAFGNPKYKYTYDGVTFTESSTEKLKEYIGEDPDDEYLYAKLNGTKYYLDTSSPDPSNHEVFYINSNGKKSTQASAATNIAIYNKYAYFIQNNNSAYRYYRDAYDFTSWIRTNLSNLETGEALDAEENPISEFDDFKFLNYTAGQYIQDYDSDFNRHRSAVIRYTIQNNLSTAIAGYKNYFENGTYIMPNISEIDWEVIENNVSMITFLQSFKIGGRDYNEYCVIANNLNKEYIDEDDIYILGSNKTYYRINDSTIHDPSFSLLVLSGAGYQPGIWKLNFEQKVDARTDSEILYFPMSYSTGTPPKVVPYIGSYSSIIASTSVDSSQTDMYKYLRGLDSGVPGSRTPQQYREYLLKGEYYTGLGRERYGRYSVNHDIDTSNMLN